MRTRLWLISHSAMALMLAATWHDAVAADATKIEQKEQSFVLKLAASRVIYDPETSAATLAVINSQDYPMLVKSDVLDEDKKTPAPFIVTPPVFRLDGQQQSRVRIVRTGGRFAPDHESLQWLCVTGIPPKPDDEWAKKNGKSEAPSKASLLVQVSVSNCIKLLVRPSSVKGSSTDVASSLRWQRQGGRLKVTNPTPFYMNLSSVSVGGKAVQGLDYVPPSGEREFPLPAGASGAVVWKVITDNGGDSRPYEGTLQ